MPLAGETIIAGKIPGERIDTELVTASVGPTSGTTELVVMTIVAPVVINRVYHIIADFGFNQTVLTDGFLSSIREDSVTGNTLQGRRLQAPTTLSPWSQHMQAQYTADATEDKTFVVTLVRTAGTGTMTLAASATQPSFLYVTYVSG